jgi:uncharacterized protein
MFKIATGPVFSATDVANFLTCHHLTTLDRRELQGEIRKPLFQDAGADLLRELGLQHEQDYLASLLDRGLNVVEIDKGLPPDEASAQTIEAMGRGVDAIYQGAFLQSRWYGRPDFLIRVDRESNLGDWSYEVVETKLARSTKARAVMQLCFYSALLAGIQGRIPRWMHVALGGQAGEEKLPTESYVAYFRKVQRDFQEAFETPEETYPEPTEHCKICSWSSDCDARRRKDDHLSLVAGITRNQRKMLVANGVDTVAKLGALAASEKVGRIGESALLRIREQARLQVQGRSEGRILRELLQPVEPDKGLAMLPSPSPADLFLDFEGYPYAREGSLEYLIGVASQPASSEAAPYEAIWSFDASQEKAAFEKLIDRVMDLWKRCPDMHVYHYGAYEATTIKRLAAQHRTRIDEVDEMLRAGLLVDLYRAVRQSLRASVESYSIKRLEPLYGFVRHIGLRDANGALDHFGTLLALGDQQEGLKIRQLIEGYNRDDCLSTLSLRNWLESLRLELENANGTPLPRPELRPGDAPETVAANRQAARDMAARLTDGLPVEQSTWTPAQAALWLLAQLLEFHWREDKSVWWEYFRLRDLSDAELIEDKDALGGLEYDGPLRREKQSIVHRYLFPAQSHSLDRAYEVRDPETEETPGTICSIDNVAGTIDIKRSVNSPKPHPKGLIPFNYVRKGELTESIMRLAAWVAENGIDGHGPFRAARDLLLRHPPRVAHAILGQGEELPASASRLVLSLDNSVLPIQGPPGSGKTYTGARMIVDLLKEGRRIGITANSHKVITNLLDEVCEVAYGAVANFQAVQKSDEDDGCEHPAVTLSANGEVLEALTSGAAQVGAGTAWLWSREEMAGSVDVLFVDEAAQMSLASVVALSQGAGSLVLLGDPQQLEQPQKGIHPDGTDVSAMAHLLNGHSTIAGDRGLLLPETWRLHPSICDFTSTLFYDGRLKPRPGNENQRLNCEGFLDGTGLRFVPVRHEGNQNESPEEASRIAELVKSLNGASWTDREGRQHPLTESDIMVVAPYNAQVSRLRKLLPEGMNIGTVDKFQGREAPVVFYSMTTSSAEEAPRGMEFLYDLHRLNVAISRARAVAVIVASPQLFDVECRTPRQIELANAFCRYLEFARFGQG